MSVKSIFTGLLFLLNITLVSAQTKSVYNVMDFGAKGDGKSLDSPSINVAIEEASKKGGGTVFLPAGTFLSGSIRMKSNINLQLDAGAILLAAPQTGLMEYYDKHNPEEYKQKRYQDQGHTFFLNSLIWGVNLKNISITGLGIINGEGLASNWNLEGSKIVGVANKAIAFKECNNVKIQGITILHGGWFGILTTGCNLLSIDNLMIDSNRDGMDIDCCSNVSISNCKVNTPSDDAICLKSSFALKRKVLTENVTITNCQVSGFQEGTLYDGRMIIPEKTKHVFRTGRIKFGTESNGGLRNCAISNCVFRACKGLALEEVDGGIMENITVNNITMYDVQTYPIYITLGERMRDPDSTAVSVGRDISISNVTAFVNDSVSGIQITGTPKFYLENIKLQHISITYAGGGTEKTAKKPFKELGKDYPEVRPYEPVPAYGLIARHVKNLQLLDVSFDFLKEDRRSPLICSDIDGLDIDRFNAKIAAGVLAVSFDDITKLTITNSPALK